MSARSVMLRGRRAAEALMVDSCEIVRTTSRGSINNSTGGYSPTTSTIYSGKCQVVQSDGSAVDVTAGERDVAVARTTVKIPTSATGVQAGDKVTVTATLDDDLDGRVLYVHEVQVRTYGTSRRLVCEEQQP